MIKITGLSILACLIVGPALAICMPRAAAVQNLEVRYQERVVGRGIAQNGRQMIELWVAENGDFSILITRPNGISCTATFGGMWFEIEPVYGEDG